MTKYPSNNGDAPPLFEALGIPDTDDSAAELGYCLTIIQAHLRKGNKLDREAVIVVSNIQNEVNHYLQEINNGSQQIHTSINR